MNRKRPAGFTPNLDLAAGDGAVAQNTDPLIVHRIPFSPEIAALQDGEFFFGEE